MGFRALSRCAILSSHINSTISDHDPTTKKKESDNEIFEAAIRKFVISCIGKKVDKMRETYPKICEVPYNFIDKIQISVHNITDKFLMIMLGEPEKVMERCTTILLDGNDIVLSNSIQEAIDSACIAIAKDGESLIAICDKILPKDLYPSNYQFDPLGLNFPLNGFRFLGLISFYDPPRPTSAHAISECRSGGIKMIMITNDHPITAKSIAKQIGIISEQSRTIEDLAEERECRLMDIHSGEASAVVVDGPQLRKLALKELEMLLTTYKENVFARTASLQKFMIVASCQKTGSIVAVTGSGVNDTLALKKADLGIALGISGTELTKENADIVLIDDSLASLAAGIEEGRLLFDNLKKSTAFTLTSNVPQLIPFIAYILLGIPLPINAFCILFVDLGTDLWPAISLAHEKEESDLMKRPPNAAESSFITRQMCFNACGQIGMIETLTCFFTYYVIMIENGWYPVYLFKISRKWDSCAINDLEDSHGQEWTYEGRKRLENKCQTCAFLTIMIVQWGNVVICKTRVNSILQQGTGNWVINFGVVFETVLALFLVFMPIDKVFHLQYINLLWCIIPIVSIILAIAYDEGRKCVIRNYICSWFCRESYY